MGESSQSVRGDAVVRRYDYGQESVIVADLGHVEGAVDLVGGTAVVLADGDQYEIDVPADASRAFMTNGIVTIEVDG
jgi:hypothetical protein